MRRFLATYFLDRREGILLSIYPDPWYLELFCLCCYRRHWLIYPAHSTTYHHHLREGHKRKRKIFIKIISLRTTKWQNMKISTLYWEIKDLILYKAIFQPLLHHHRAGAQCGGSSANASASLISTLSCTTVPLIYYCNDINLYAWKIFIIIIWTYLHFIRPTTTRESQRHLSLSYTRPLPCQTST